MSEEQLITAENQQQQEQLQTSALSISTGDVTDLETEEPKHMVYEKIHSMAENFASTHIGQFVIERCDGALKTVETTARWSLPQVQDTSAPKLERPLSWLPFLSLIVVLRVIRVWCSVGALFIGDGPITARDMVRFIQTRRRKLRAVRLNGLKAINQRETEASAGAEIGIVRKVRKLFAVAICRPGQERGRVFVHRSKEQLCNNKDVVDTPKRSNFEKNQKSDLNMTCLELLNKYADVNSSDDSDYVPDPNEETNDDGSSSSSDEDVAACSINIADKLEQEQQSNTTTEVTDKDAAEPSNEASSPSKNHDCSVEIKEKANGRKHPMPKPLAEIKNEPMSDYDSSSNEQQAQTPKENGPSTPPTAASRNSDGQGETQADVAQTVKDIAVANILLTLPNGGNQLQQQQPSTPEHESAAMSKPLLPAVLGTTATAVPTNTDEQSSSSSSSLSFLCNNSSTSTAANPANLLSFSALSHSASSSSSSLASDFLTNEEFIVNDNLSEPRTPTPTLYSSSSNIGNIGRTNLISTSSSEDIFYSPIGSPPDFNATFKPVSILKKPIVEQPRLSEVHSTPKNVVEAERGGYGSAESHSDSSAGRKKNTPNQQKKPNQPQKPHRKYNRR